MSAEVFKMIPGFENRYMVSDLGNVMTLDFGGNGKGKRQLMTPVKTACGYTGVKLGKDRKRFGVHQLVMLAFGGPCPEGKEVDHINGIRDDNRLENLRYVTRGENIRAAIHRHGGKMWGGFGKATPEQEAKRIARLRERLAGKPAKHAAKFSAVEAYLIRLAVLGGLATRKGLARQLGVTVGTIKGAVNQTTLSYQG